MILEFWQQLVSRPDFLAMLTIPPVTAVVTWLHVWMALKMLFYPIHFWGIKIKWLPQSFKDKGFLGLGWQGIVPRKAGKISGIITDQTLTKLGSLEEFVNAMDPQEMADLMSLEVNKNLEQLIDEVMLETRPILWENLPYALKRRIYRQAQKQLPQTMRDLVSDLTFKVEDLVNMREMVVNKMENDRALMVKMFLRVGQKEINFIWHISFFIGFIFGIIQMGVYIAIPDKLKHDSVPAFAMIWGALTNWIAIWMVFNPVEPKHYRYLKFFELRKKLLFIRFVKPHIAIYNFQGAFMKRQTEVSSVFASVVVEELITVQTIMNEMIYGSNKDKTRRIIKRHIHAILETPIVRTTLQFSLGLKDYAKLKNNILDKSIDATLEPINNPELNASRASKIFGLFRDRILALTPKEFENLLRPAFKEDEITLIILGGVTGILAGIMHLLLVFVK